MTIRLAHLTDLHFGEAPAALVDSLAEDVRAQAPDAVLVSGDLSLRARGPEFAQAWSFLAGLGVPVLAVPGNHDIPPDNLISRFLHPRRRWLAGMPPDAVQELMLKGISVIGLDTVRRAQWHLDWSAGGVPPSRREALRAVLDSRREARCLVLCHHPMRHPSGMGHRRLPVGAQAVLALLEAQGVEAVLSGHLHVAALLPGPGPLQVITPSALSPRGARPNGWTLLELGMTGIAWRHRAHIDNLWQERDMPAQRFQTAPAGL